MHLASGEVILRPYRPDDREQLQRIADNIKVSRFMADIFPSPYTMKEADDWIALNQSEKRRCNFAVEWRGELIGGIGLTPLTDVHSGTTNFGYWFGEPYWGHGLATSAVAAILPYAFDELLFIRLQAIVFSGNTPSMRVLEKNGFVREGVMRKHVRKNGVIHDAFLYAKLRNDN